MTRRVGPDVFRQPLVTADDVTAMAAPAAPEPVQAWALKREDFVSIQHDWLRAPAERRPTRRAGHAPMAGRTPRSARSVARVAAPATAPMGRRGCRRSQSESDPTGNRCGDAGARPRDAGTPSAATIRAGPARTLSRVRRTLRSGTAIPFRAPPAARVP